MERLPTETLERDTPAAYTTTLKLMQIMHDKELVRRDASQLVLRALSTKKASKAELNAIRSRLDELEKKRSPR